MLLSRRVDLERRMGRTPPVTLGLLAALVGVYGAEVATGATASASGLVAAGALEARAVGGGQYWRLLTASLLHGGFDHLVGNLLALYILGMVCEPVLGRAQYVLLYAASAVAGSLASLVLSPGPAVGASGALFGLQGAAVVLFRRHRDRLLLRDRRLGVVLGAWALYAILVGLVTPWVDNGAHLGGAVAGALLGRVLHPVVLEPMPAAHARRVRRGLWALAGFALYSLAGWLAR
jgi:rhomboid protease GluP